MVKERMHQCNFWASEELPFDYPANMSVCQKFKKFVIEKNMVSKKNAGTKFQYRSGAAIRKARFEHFMTYPYIIHPFSTFKIFYDIYWFFILTNAIIILPMHIPFRLNWTTKVISVLCLIDIIISFFTGYIHNKVVVLHPKKIALHYLKTHFFLDIISSSATFVHPYVYPLAILKIIRLITVKQLIFHCCTYFKIPEKYQNNIQLLMRIFLIFHWFACILYVVPYQINFVFELHQNNSVLILSDMIEEDGTTTHPNWWIYLKLFFNATCNILSIGDGLAKPRTHEDMLQLIYTWTMGLMFKIYIFLEFFNSYSAAMAAKTDYLEAICQVKDYMQSKQLPMHMQKRMLCYYERRFQSKYFAEEQINTTLSSKLNREINKYSCQRTIESVSIFKQLPKTIIDDVINVLKPEVFLPNDVIIRGGGYGDAMFFLANGTVSVVTSTGKEICHLQDGAYFGEISLVLKDHKRIASVIALEFCECFRLDRKEFKRSFKKRSDLFKVLETTANERANHTQLIEELHKKQLLEDIMKAELAEKLKGENM